VPGIVPPITPRPLLEVRIPLLAVIPTAPPTDFAPSPASVQNHAELPGDALSAIDRCSVCHADVFAQWSESAHRFSSLDNPFYLPSFRAARETRGPEVTRWCGGCHDPALLFAHDLDQPQIDRSHERAALGIGCLLCHSVNSIHDRTGNGNYEVSTASVVVPPRENPSIAEVEHHRQRMMRPLLRTSDFCGSCHKVGITEVVNDAHWLRGQNELDPWDQSAWAGHDVERHDPDVTPQTCQQCHMPREAATRGDLAAKNGTVRSHRFGGGHTALAAWVGSAEMMATEQRALVGAVRLDVMLAPDSQGHGAAPLETHTPTVGEDLLLDVVMVNEKVGHRFPSGTADVADTWLEVIVRDGDRVVAQSGTLTPTDPGPLHDDAHRLEVRPLDDHGAPALMRDPHRYRALAYDTTIPARAARVVRYAWHVTRMPTHGSYTVSVRLLHRRLGNPYVTTTCRTAQTDQGRPCPTVWPVTVVASHTLEPGNVDSVRRLPALDASLTASWRRWYDHARALVEWNVQEHVGQALGSIEQCLAEAPDRAEPYVERARLAIRQGRTDEAYQWLDAAAQRAPHSPVIPYLRGVAGSDVWRWNETVEPLGNAWRLASGNVRVAEVYANSLGIAGRHQEALTVITRGLAIDSERAQLHNLQALELQQLGFPDEAAIARTAWERYRTPDTLPGLRGRCKRDIPQCALETEPLHTHSLTVPH
jgi:hypothetical protein